METGGPGLTPFERLFREAFYIVWVDGNHSYAFRRFLLSCIMTILFLTFNTTVVFTALHYVPKAFPVVLTLAVLLSVIACAECGKVFYVFWQETEAYREERRRQHGWK